MLVVAVVGFLLIAGVVVWRTRPRNQAATMAIAPPPPPYIDPSTAGIVPNRMYESADAPTRIDDLDGSGDYEDVNSRFNTPAATATAI